MKGPVCEQTYLRNYSIGVLEALTRCELGHVLGKWKRNDTNRKQQVSAIGISFTNHNSEQLVFYNCCRLDAMLECYQTSLLSKN